MTEIPFSSRPAIAEAVRYDGLSIVLHWASAGLIMLNWLLGQFREFAPHGSPRAAVLSTHILIGLAIAAMLLARLAWRAGPGRRFAAEPGVMGRAAKMAHLGLYALIGLTVIAGVSHAMAHHGIRLFGTVLTQGFGVGPGGALHWLGGLHGKAADLLVLAAAAHGLAALGHHVVFGDGILIRMAPFLGGGARRAGG